MPEFDTIAIVVLAIAIVGIIIITAKSRLASNNVTMNVGGNTTMSDSLYKLATVGIVAIIVFVPSTKLFTGTVNRIVLTAP